MDFLPKKDNPTEHDRQPTKKDNPTEHDRQPTTSELFSSAKLVAAAAQASLGKGGDKIDKAKVAAAAEDLLEATSKYGKLDPKTGLGQQIEKAETYLHQYHSNTLPTATPGTTGSGDPAPADKKESSAGGDDDKSGSGFGGAFKMAQGFLK